MKFLVLSLLLLVFANSAFAANSKTSLQIIMDDSGVLIEPAQADQYKLRLLSHIKNLTRRREFARSHIDVISTARARTIWSGTPSDLKRKPARALALVNAIKAKPEHCNNLTGAFIELKSNIAGLVREGFNKIHVIVFSSLIHTPLPCGKNTHISLPQAPPLASDINEDLHSSAHIHSIAFYWVSPHQKRVWGEYLQSGINSAFTLMDMERSKYELSQGLDLGVR